MTVASQGCRSNKTTVRENIESHSRFYREVRGRRLWDSNGGSFRIYTAIFNVDINKITPKTNINALLWCFV